MAASPTTTVNDDNPPHQQPLKHTDNWSMDVEPARDHMGPGGDMDTNGAPHPADERGAPGQEPADYPAPASVSGSTTDTAVARADAPQRGEKLIKPNKVYIGGLPEHTRKEDLESCFGKIGNIVNIELKVGYGFVEFDNREAAEESVAKYHEGYFMGNKIRVEISHGGGRTAKYSGDPGACFKCGQMGHWARECPNHVANGRRPGSDASLIDRIQPPRDYLPPPRDYYRDYPGYLPPRDPRYYDYPPPPPPPGRDSRYGRPPSPVPRDYPPPPVPVRSSRDYDDYRMRGVPPPPPARYDSRAYYVEGEPVPPGYPPRGYPPPPPREYYDRYDRRAPPAADRYGSYPPAASVRPRTPPGAPPARSRDDYDRPPARDYPPASETRGRPASPPPARYADYPPRSGSVEATRYRSSRRSQSPPSRSASAYESSRYESGSGGAAYNGGTSGTYTNGYSSTNGGAAPPARSSGSTRDYPPRSARDAEPASSYRRT
ncbi:hypothetical protein C8Q70DRAFT_1051102 [Cubamyces menziesii]|nr:hypothetical protein C8Q70DRAFT_1051102 [Cubamyces menziesii]